MNPYLRMEQDTIQRLAKVYPHPKTRKKGISGDVLSELTGIPSPTCYKYLAGRIPDLALWNPLSKVFGIYFTNDPTINNQAVIKELELEWNRTAAGAKL